MDNDNCSKSTTLESVSYGRGRSKKNGMPVRWYADFKRHGLTKDDAEKYWDKGNRTLPAEWKKDKPVYTRKTALLEGEKKRVQVPDEDKGDYYQEFVVGGEAFKIGHNERCFSVIHGNIPRYYKDFSGVLGLMKQSLTKKNLSKIKTLDDLVNLDKNSMEEINKFADRMSKHFTPPVASAENS